MMALPTYVVELSFGSSGYIDVTQYVQSVSFDRGISRVLEDYSAGSISVTFVNNNRVFDPLNTSSPLYYATGGYTIVQPGGNIRISSNGVRRFTGFVQDWQFTYDAGGFDGKATVTALDELYRANKVVFTGGTAVKPQATSDRMATVLNENGFGAGEYSGVQAGQTLVGLDVYNSGDSVLGYLQNLARSEPGDLFSNAYNVLVFKDRSFADYVWANTYRTNWISYPSDTLSDTVAHADSGTWTLLGTKATTTASQFGGIVYRGGTVNGPVPDDQFVGFSYKDLNPTRWSAAGTSYVFSAYLSNYVGDYTGTMELDASDGTLLAFTAFTATSTTTDWTRISGTVTYSGTASIGKISILVGVGMGTSYIVAGEGFLLESGTALNSYFDGGWNPGVDSATARNRVGWAGTAYASQSVYLTSASSTTTAATVLTFADANSQSSVGGTGIPFMDLQVLYGSENLYNRVQVIGVNATATANDTVLQSGSRYGLRVYSQTDNLTTSVSRPNDIASALLAEWRLPEYRAEQITIALEALTNAQQTLVLGLELRDVVRVLFKPSATGSIVDKYYQVLGISADADVERDHVVLRLASLDNLPIRLDSSLLAVLDTDTLG